MDLDEKNMQEKLVGYGLSESEATTVREGLKQIATHAFILDSALRAFPVNVLEILRGSKKTPPPFLMESDERMGELTRFAKEYQARFGTEEVTNQPVNLFSGNGQVIRA